MAGVSLHHGKNVMLWEEEGGWCIPAARLGHGCCPPSQEIRRVSTWRRWRRGMIEFNSVSLSLQTCILTRNTGSNTSLP